MFSKYEGKRFIGSKSIYLLNVVEFEYLIIVYLVNLINHLRWYRDRLGVKPLKYNHCAHLEHFSSIMNACMN